jgi:ribonuclease Z
MNQQNTKVILLGTGNPNPDPKHSGPSVAIIVGGTPYIIDFGPGLIRQAAKLTPQYGGNIPELESKNLDKAFLTHLHSDHTIGYADLILTPWVMGRNQPLEVYGPEGTKKLTHHILKAYQEDIQYRLYGLEPVNSQGWRVTVHEITKGEIYSDEKIQVEAFLVKHGNWPNAYGYRFTTSDKVITVSGDTAPCENIRQFSYGVDILLHEVYYHAAFARKDPLWQNYHANHHTSTLELAKLAKETKPGLLIAYHTLYWGATNQDIVDEISSIYSGAIMIGEDLLVIE